MKYISLVFGLILTLSANAQIVGRVIEVQGNAFSFFGDKIQTLKYGNKLEDVELSSFSAFQSVLKVRSKK